MNGIVYGLYCVCETCLAENPEEVRYVGITVKKLEHRLRDHLNEAGRGSQKAKDNWIRKHLRENIRARELEAGLSSIEELRISEVGWIARMGTFGTPRGLNLTRGGDGVWGYTFSDEIKARFRERTATQLATMNHPRAKITREDVLEIVARIWAGETTADISRDYPISAAGVQKIRSGENWPNVPRPPGNPPPPPRGRGGQARIPLSVQQAIWDEHALVDGEGKRLSLKYGVSESTVSLIVNGHRGLPAKLVG